MIFILHVVTTCSSCICDRSVATHLSTTLYFANKFSGFVMALNSKLLPVAEEIRVRVYVMK
jgi:hypothetical protein